MSSKIDNKSANRVAQRWLRHLRGADHQRAAMDGVRMISDPFQRSANAPTDFINGKTTAIAKAVSRKMKGLKSSRDREPDLASNAGGFIKYMFKVLGNNSAYHYLHSFLGNMSGVGSGVGVEKELEALAREISHRIDEGDAVGIGLLLLRGARRPRAATYFEAWAQKNLDLTSHNPAESATGKVPAPSVAFETDITPQIASYAALVWQQIGKSPVNAEALAFEVAGDVNWHSIQSVASDPSASVPHDLVGKLSQKLDYDLVSVAAFIVALLRLAGMKSKAESVKKEALREFAEAYGTLARVASR